MSPVESFAGVDRQIKLILRAVQRELLSKNDRRVFEGIRLVSNDIKLDLRDYVFAEKRIEQQTHIVQAQKNLTLLEQYLLSLGDIFGPADVAELSARIGQIRSSLL